MGLIEYDVEERRDEMMLSSGRRGGFLYSEKSTSWKMLVSIVLQCMVYRFEAAEKFYEQFCGLDIGYV